MLEDKLQSRFDRKIRKLMKKYKVKGLSVAIASDKKMLFERYEGIVSHEGLENSSEKMMMIGSNTKILTALAIMVLYERKLLSLDVDIREYLPSFDVKTRFGAFKITIKDLLMHVSGLPSDDYDLITSDAFGLDDVLKVLKETYLTSKPQTMFSYSNLGYGVLGLIIEKVSQVSYKTFLKEAVTEPLDLEIEILENADLRKTYGDAVSESFDVKGNVVEDPLSTIISAGSSTYATLNALVKLGQVFLDPSSQNVLETKTIHMMLEIPEIEHFISNSHGIGLGLRMAYYNFYNPMVGTIIGHGGNTIYHHSTLDFSLDHKFCVAVMTNSEKGAFVANQLSKYLIIEYVKALGIEMPKRIKTKPSLLPYKNNIFDQGYVLPGLKVPIQFDRQQNPIFKIQILKFTVKPVADALGVYQAIPRGLSRLPILAGAVKRLQLIPHHVEGEDVLYVTQNDNYSNVTAAFASKYQVTSVPNTWENALGSYTIENDNKALKSIASELQLVKTKQDDLVLELKMMKQKLKLYLIVLDDFEALVQGYGRGAKETVFLTLEDERYFLRVLGIRAKKDK